MSAPLVAGVDSSTQSCKVVVHDAETGRLVRSGRSSHPDGTEIDPEAWWEALGTAVADAGGLDGVEAISVAAQQHGLIALDAEGRVIRPALLWNDTRSAQAAADLVGELGAETWARRTGIVPVASFTVTKLRWLAQHEPENVARTAAVTLPHDWLTWRLRGYGPPGESVRGPHLEALTTDASDASGTGYWDPGLARYDPELFTLAFGRPLREAGSADHSDTAVIVPRVLGAGERAEHIPEGIPLSHGMIAPEGLVVGVGAGDNAAAALGLGLGTGDVAISLGTSGTVFGVSAVSRPDPSGTVAGFADAAGGRLPIVTTLNAARILDIVAELLSVTHEDLGRLALRAPAGADGLILVPYFIGERTPNLPDATGSLRGMTPQTTTRTHLARAAIEGMLRSLVDGLAAVQQSGLETERLLLVGGAARNRAVVRIAARMFARDIEIPSPGEYVAAGAARQAAWALTGRRPSWKVESRMVAAAEVV